MNNNNNEKTDWAKRDIGALWKRESTSQKYLSGYVKIDELGIQTEVKIVVFSNKNKKDNPKAPDYRIYISKPNQNQTQEVEKTATKNNIPAKKIAKKVLVEESDTVEDDSIL